MNRESGFIRILRQWKSVTKVIGILKCWGTIAGFSKGAVILTTRGNHQAASIFRTYEGMCYFYYHRNNDEILKRFMSNHFIAILTKKYISLSLKIVKLKLAFKLPFKNNSMCFFLGCLVN